MTQTQADQPRPLDKYDLLPVVKVEKALFRLDRMANFYYLKKDLAPEQQALMFEGFINSLNFAREVLVLHDELTKELELLAQGGSGETRTNSSI